MQPKQSGSGPTYADPSYQGVSQATYDPTSLEGSSTSATTGSLLSHGPDQQPNPPGRAAHRRTILRLSILGALLLLGGVLLVIVSRHPKPATTVGSDATQRFSTIEVPLEGIANDRASALATAGSVSVNGRLNVNSSLVLAPTVQPSAAVAGQLYFDRTTNRLSYFNGSGFDSVATNTNSVGSIGGRTGSIDLGNGLGFIGGRLAYTGPTTGVLSLQGQTGNLRFSNGAGINIAGTTISNSGILSIGGATGDIRLGSGLSIENGTLNNTTSAAGVSNIGGVSGSISLGNGLSVTPGGQLNSTVNPGITGVTAGNNITVASDGNGGVVVSATSIGGNVSSAGGTTGKLAYFSGTQTLADSMISQNGSGVTVAGDLRVTGSVTLDNPLAVSSGGTGANSAAAARVNIGAAARGSNVDITSIGGLTTALTVGQGGTGLQSLSANQLLFANTASSISQLSNGLSGLCLISNGTGSAPSFQTCTGAGGVSSVSGQTGAITLNGTANRISIINSGGTFTFSAPQDLATTSSVQFGSVSAGTFNGDGAAVTNVDAAKLGGNTAVYYTNATNLDSGTLDNDRLSARVTLQGNTFNGASQLVQLDTSGYLPNLNGSLLTALNANSIGTGTVADARLSPNVSLYDNTTSNFTGSLQQNGNAVCTTAGNCIGVSGGAIGGGGTVNKLALFTGTGYSIGDSLLSQDAGATTVSITGNLSVSGTVSATSLSGNGSGISNVNAAQLNGQTGAYYTNATNLSTGTVANARLVGSGALGVTAGTGLSGGGSVALGGSTSLSVVYGAASGQAVQGNTTLTCAGGTGNLSGGGTTITLGTGGSCGAISITTTPSFDTVTLGNGTSVAGKVILRDGSSTNTATIQLAGALSANQTYALPSAGGTVCVLEAGNCTGANGGGVSSVNGQSGGLTLNGTANQVSVTNSGSTFTFATPQDIGITSAVSFGTLNASTLIKTSNTTRIDASGNLSNIGTINTSGLVTAGNGLTVSTGNITFNNLTGGASTCLTLNASNQVSTSTCATGSGSNPTLQNTYDNSGTTPIINLSTTGKGVFIQDAATPVGGSLFAVRNSTGTTSYFAVTTAGASVTGTLSATNLSGDGSAVNNVNATQLNGQSGSYYLNATNINAGTLADGRLSGNVTLQGNTFNGANQLVELDASGYLPALNGSALTNVNAAQLNGQAASYYLNAGNLNAGTLSDARLSTNVALYNRTTSNFTGALQQGGNNVCTTAGNCNGVSGGAINGGGTASKIAVFTGTGYSLGDSMLSQNAGGTVLTISGDVNVSGSLSATNLSGNGSGVTNVNAAQLNGQAGSYYTNATNISSGSLSDSRLSTNVALLNGNNNFTGATLQHNGNNVCDASNNCNYLTGSAANSAYVQFAPAGAQGNSSADDSIFINNTGTAANFLTLQKSGTTKVSITSNGAVIATSFSGDGSAVTNVNATQLNGQAGSYYTNATNISSGTLADTRLSTNVTLQGNTFNGVNQLLKLNSSGYVDSSLLNGNYSSITGVGTLGSLNVAGQTVLGGNADQAQVIIKAASGQSVSNPFIVLKSAAGAELARIGTNDSTSIFIGNQSGRYQNNFAAYNTAFGANTLVNNYSGADNAAVGYGSLYNNYNGSGNSTNGSSALSNNQTGNLNTALGYSSLTNNTSGSNNTGVGANTNVSTNNLQNATALGANAYVSANDSLVLGCVAGTNSCATTTKIGIGTSAPTGLFSVGSSSQFQVDINGNTLTTGTIQGSNLTATGTIKSGTTSATGSLILQDGTANNRTITLTTAAQTVGSATITIPDLAGANATICLSIGNCTALGTAGGDLSGTYPNPTVAKIQNTAVSFTTIATGDVLQYNGSSIVNTKITNSNLAAGSFGNITGVGVLGSLAVGSSSQFQIDISGNTSTNGKLTVGGDSNQAQLTVVANNSQTSYYPLILLQNAGGSELARVNAPDAGSLYLGFQAGFSSPIGASSVGIGASALRNSTGSSNVAVGAYTLYNNTTGSANVGAGAYILSSNTTGNSNSAFGDHSLQSNSTGNENSGFGASSLTSVTTGSQNTGVGSGTLLSTNSGSKNAGFGYYTLRTNTSGSQNTAIGSYADVSTINLQNATALGAFAQVGQSDSLVLGCINGTNGCTATTKVGIGTTTPSGLFSVGSTSQFQVDISGNIQTTGTASITGLVSANGGLSIASTKQFTNSGATVNTPYAIATDFPTNGSIGTAAATVDVTTAISIRQTTAGRTLTIPDPTASTVYGRTLYITNVGTAAFNLAGATVNLIGSTPINPGVTTTLIWANTNGGPAWTFAGADGSGILNQNTTTQTANFQISGTGSAATSLQAPVFQTTDISAASTTSAALTLRSGNSTASGGTGAVTIKSGDATSGNSGAITIDSGSASGTVGAILIGTAATTQNIQLGTGGGVKTVQIGTTTGASTVNIAGGNGASAVLLQAAGSGGIVIGSTNGINSVNIGNTTATSGTQNINIGTSIGAGATTAIAIGNNIGASSLNLTSGTGNTNIMSTGAINIGTSTSTGVTIGRSGVTTTIAGAPAASATASLLQLGSAINAGSSVTNGGTYLSINAPASGPGSAADLINLEYNGSNVFKVSNDSITYAYKLNTQAGLTTLGSLITGSTGQFQVDSSGNASTSGSLTAPTLKSAGATPLAVDAGGNALLGLGTTSANAVQISRTGMNTLVNGSFTSAQLLTANGGVVNTGSTRNQFLALGDLAAGPIGSAASTVDISTGFSINPSASDRTYTIPTPTDTTAGRSIYISNISSNSLSISVSSGTYTVAAGSNVSLLWNGTVWNVDNISTGITTLGSFSLTGQANGGSVSGNTLSLSAANATNPGLVSTTDQTFGGNKTFTGATTVTNTGSNAFSVQNAGGIAALGVDTTNGAVLISSLNNSTIALKITDSSGNVAFVVDAANKRVGINTGTPGTNLSVNGGNNINPNYPDGLAGTPVIATVTTSNGSSSTLYTVPNGKTLYVTNLYFIDNGSEGVCYVTVNGMRIANAVSESDPFSQSFASPLIIPAGATITAGCNTANNTSALLNGLLLNPGVTPVFASASISSGGSATLYTVPTGKTLYLSTAYFSATNKACSLNANGSAVLLTTLSSTRNFASPFVFPAGTVISGSCITGSTSTPVINGYLTNSNGLGGL